MYSAVWLRRSGGGGHDRGDIDQGEARQVQEYTCWTGLRWERLAHPQPSGSDSGAPRVGVCVCGGAPPLTPSVLRRLDQIAHLISVSEKVEGSTRLL